MAGGRLVVLTAGVCVVLGGLLTVKPSSLPPIPQPPEHRGDTGISTAITDVYCPGVCVCSGGYVECLRMNLTDIPEDLPNDTMHLSLDGNLLASLNSQMFRNLYLMVSFSAVQNRIAIVKKGTFSELPNLTDLDLSKNPLHVSALENIFCSLQSPQEITMDAIFQNEQITLSNETFRCLDHAELYLLSLQHNNFGDFRDGLFDGVTVDDLNLCNTTSVGTVNTKAFQGIRGVEALNMVMNNLSDFPHFSINGISLFPNLTKLLLMDNSFKKLTVAAMQGLDNLGVLYLNNVTNADENFYVEPATFASLPSLSQLEFQDNLFNLAPENDFEFQSATLKYLDVSGVRFFLPRSKTVPMSFNMFRTLTNLTGLTAKQMDFSLTPIRELYFADAFRNLTNLNSLDLSKNRLSILHPEMFKGSHNLQTLTLKSNLLTQWHYSVFTELNSLQYLDISSNTIQIVGQKLFPQNGQYLAQLSSLKLRGNPFRCTCSLLWFLEFVRAHSRPNIVKDIDKCRCAYPSTLKGISILDIPVNSTVCAVHRPATVDISIAVAAFLLIVLTVSLVYRWRWHIIFIHFQMKSKYFNNDQQIDNTLYSYDAFVSYHAKSLRWVKTDLLHLLEDKLGFKVCLHDRDWLAGRDIVENIVASIEGSRKIILVVTNAFARSQWCQLELTMAQHHLLEEDKNNLILIMMEEIHYNNMTPRLALQMKTQTYIEWEENPKAKELFKKRLEQAVKRPSVSTRMQAV